MSSFFFTPERPHFFKVITEETLETGMLEIPKKFVIKYGCSLPNSVLLRLPDGAVWPIEVYENNDGVWLVDGWKEFADFYSLGYGHLLVFQHKGSSDFQVIIFDNSAMEIKYPKYSNVIKEEPERSVDEDSVEIVDLDDFDTSQRSRERTPLKSPNPQYSEPKLGTPRSSCKKIGDGGGSSTGGMEKFKAGIVKKRLGLTSKEKAEAFLRADFHSENPYFMVVMQPRYVYTQYELTIPIDFARRHLGPSNTIDLVSDERTWPARYHCYPKLEKPKATICYGWRSFVKDNNIKVGDLCVFELFKTSPICLEVFIFRGD
ncbi:B3 domain-containing transcription factor VRN1-like [Tripterygium wilfordii]|uniref:B3 domain-containing transcription factor VRN1-like n=1 Tax=Tripterygium wilfordii TaxID=458696 RepID=UPI0018F84477|nr:B3 domain-containing transcription factor VRN1-like [Tripterygium wilfordii]